MFMYIICNKGIQVYINVYYREISVLICFSNLSDLHISKQRMKIPGTLEEDKNTNRKKYFPSNMEIKMNS